MALKLNRFMAPLKVIFAMISWIMFKIIVILQIIAAISVATPPAGVAYHHIVKTKKKN